MAIESGFDLTAQASFDLIKSVYDSTDTFAADFDQEYPSPSALSGSLAEIGTRPGSLFLVFREADELLGYLLVAPKTAAKLRHTAELGMGVRAAARGRGVGSTLLNTALSRLRNEGIIEIVYLMVRADNRAAVRLYEKLGFETLATLTGDTKIGSRYHDGILMRSWIAQAAALSAGTEPLYSADTPNRAQFGEFP